MKQPAKIRVRTDSSAAQEETVQLLLADAEIESGKPDPNMNDDSNPVESCDGEKSKLELVQANVFYGAAEEVPSSSA